MTDSVSGATTVPTTQPWATDLDGGAALSAESLMVYCQTRLGSLDDEIKGLMDEQRAAIRQKEVLTELRGALREAKDVGHMDGIAEGVGIQQAIAAYNTAIEQLPQGDPLRMQLVQERDKALFEADADPGLPSQSTGSAGEDAAASEADTVEFYAGSRKDLTSEDWDAVTDAVDALIERVNDDAEISMIQLQSLMSTRQTAISLTTNVLSKLQAAEKAIVDNIR